MPAKHQPGLSDITLLVSRESGRVRTVKLRSQKDLKKLGKLLMQEIFGEESRATKVQETRTTSGAESKKSTPKKGSHTMRLHRPFTTLDKMIHFLTKNLTRLQANELLKREIWNLLPPDLVEKYKTIQAGETFHIRHVRRCMDKLLPNKVPNQHDHSKTELYFFLTNCAYKLTEHCSVGPKLLEDTIARHHKREAHHPEFEKWNKKKDIEETDIIEIAVDRLSRNLQANSGDYNTRQLVTYEPKFVREHKKKIAIYRAYSDSLQPSVRTEWERMKEGQPITE